MRGEGGGKRVFGWAGVIRDWIDKGTTTLEARLKKREKPYIAVL
jgi:hypothetical protein